MTTIVDLVMGGLRLADREKTWLGPSSDNANLISTATLYSWANEGAGELYGLLCSTYEDYNVTPVLFSLAGGSNANNQLLVGPGTAIPDFFQPRKVQLQIQNGPTPFVTIPRVSLLEEDAYTVPNIVPVYGAIPTGWTMYGNRIQMLPGLMPANTYRLVYVPALPQLIDPNATQIPASGITAQTIDQYWMTVNGWQQYISLHVAVQVFTREDSLDEANALRVEKDRLKLRILNEAKPRDVSQAHPITDMKRMRNPFWGWGQGPGVWDGGTSGNGNW